MTHPRPRTLHLAQGNPVPINRGFLFPAALPVQSHMGTPVSTSCPQLVISCFFYGSCPGGRVAGGGEEASRSLGLDHLRLGHGPAQTARSRVACGAGRSPGEGRQKDQIQPRGRAPEAAVHPGHWAVGARCCSAPWALGSGLLLGWGGSWWPEPRGGRQIHLLGPWVQLRPCWLESDACAVGTWGRCLGAPVTALPARCHPQKAM